ncbi:MAG: ABC-F family ATP-binding cassette domain-containing protein [Rhodospirillales bacterium]|nr:ABC-F family ATP-binding cassette domain-containing protein [Rhodospirillales bacterium]
MLHINDLTYRIGARLLFDQATVAIASGHRVGLVGRNGSGKTTLFKLILGELGGDEGAIKIRKSMSVGTVAQEAPAGPESLISTVLAADHELSDLNARAKTATDPQDIAEIHTRLADIDAQTAPARAARILAGLGFDEEAQNRGCTEFSGGWRMRVALAATLFARPDLLLLDEPTNHLDLEAALWLEDYLAAWQGTIIIISHDRTLLNKVVTQIIHLDDCKLNRYTGGYDQFENTRRERQNLDAKLRTKQIAERQKIEAFVDRFRAKASKARQAQSRVKMLERMEPIASAATEQTVTFNFPNPPPLSPPLITLDELDVGYTEGKPILKKLDLRIDMDDRIGLLGANGNGKSTLVKLLADRLKPMAGTLRKSSKLRIGYFAQHQTDELIVEQTPYDHAARAMPMATVSKVRAHLGSFGFSGDKANTVCGNLSGGEKARLLFALMSLEAPHVLLLDEPTNHLDVDAREALVQALNAYDGAVILVSHDAHLLELSCDRLWQVGGGKVTPFDGDLGDYRKMLVEQRRDERRAQRSDGDTEAPKTNRKLQRQERAAQRAETADLRKSVKTAEKKLERLAHKRDELEKHLSDPKIYGGSTAKLMELQVEMGTIKSQMEKAEEHWLQMTEALEKAS